MIKATGTITKGGAQFHLGTNEGLRIFFVPMDPPRDHFDSYAGIFDNDRGRYEVVGKDGKGLPPGRYRITIQLIKKKEDLFKGQLTGEKSPFTCEVASGSTEVPIDLDQAKGLLISSR
jgi:hypothetical protein